jgi:hypothetical protein
MTTRTSQRRQVSTDEYEFSHGHTPRGRGAWIFAPAGRENDMTAWVTKSGTYTEAKRQLPAGEWTVLS